MLQLLGRRTLDQKLRGSNPALFSRFFHRQ